jgi:hypothetical protein
MSRLSPSLAESYRIGYRLRGGQGSFGGPILSRSYGDRILIGCIGFTFVLLVEESRTNTKVLCLNVGLLMLSHFGKIEMQRPH